VVLRCFSDATFLKKCLQQDTKLNNERENVSDDDDDDEDDGDDKDVDAVAWSVTSNCPTLS